MKFQQWEPDLLTLVSRIDAGEIDLQPDFQRQEVWNVPKQRKLIDTILREWSMPPIHLIDAGRSVLEVLDGQQRLAAIRDFVHGKFSVDGRVEPLQPYIFALDGMKYNTLPMDIRRRLDRYTVRAFRISDFSPEEPSELFYRLNQPTLLTAGEQRNSLYGPARSQLKDLVQLFQEYNSKEDIGFSNARLAYDDVLARQLYFLSIGTLAVKANEGQISDYFRSGLGFSEEVLNTTRTAIGQFSAARRNVGKTRLNKASLLSWLLFFSRGEPDSAKEYMFTEFVETERRGTASDIAVEARALFDDRASGRVTDISSVFLRDVCLWLYYADTFRFPGPDEYTTDCLSRISSVYDRHSNSLTLEAVISSIVSIELWGSLA